MIAAPQRAGEGHVIGVDPIAVPPRNPIRVGTLEMTTDYVITIIRTSPSYATLMELDTWLSNSELIWVKLHL